MSSWTPERVGMGWEFHHPDGVRLTVGQQHTSGHYLYANHELRWENGTRTRLLSAGMINLTANTTPNSIAKQAAAKVPDRDRDWDWLEEILLACKWVADQNRQGRPAQRLARIDDAEFKWLLRPWIEHGGHTRLIAAGGSRKSFLALAMCLSIATGSADVLGVAPTTTGPVLYLDWETNDGGRTHAYRLRAVARGAGVEVSDDIIHHQHDRPLAERVEGVAELADREGVVMVVVDSNTWARGSGGRGGIEAATLDFLEALRHINRPTLIIDHKSKEQMDKGKKGGYGFVHNENQVRLQWETVAVHDTLDPDTLRVRYENTKANNVAQQPDQAFEIRFDNDRSDADRPRLIEVRLDPVPAQLVRGVHPGTEDTTNADIIWRTLEESTEALTVSVIAVHTGIDKAVVRETLRRNEHRFASIAASRPARWTTKDRDPRNQLPDPFGGTK